MIMEKIIFIVSRVDINENVIVPADNREVAKRAAYRILLGDADKYIVDPITKYGSQTVILLVA